MTTNSIYTTKVKYPLRHKPCEDMVWFVLEISIQLEIQNLKPTIKFFCHLFPVSIETKQNIIVRYEIATAV